MVGIRAAAELLGEDMWIAVQHRLADAAARRPPAPYYPATGAADITAGRAGDRDPTDPGGA